MFNLTKRNETQEAAPIAPALDVFENDKEFVLFADVPGVPQGAAEITLNQERLVVEAKGNVRKYRRELIVPPSVDPEKISAALQAGVLKVVLPKRAPYQPRQIPVSAAS